MLVDIYGYDADMPTSYKLRKNFTLGELANNLGDPKLAQFIINDEVDTFLTMLQQFREWYNKPMTVNSCYRQQTFNKKVGGDKNSAHLRACALDWAIKGHTETQRMNVYKQWEMLCKLHKVVGAINYYTNGYHFEIYSDKWYGNKAFTVRDYRSRKGDW